MCIRDRVEMTKSRMPRGQYKDWLLASASAFPAFPLCRIGGEAYIDGGYYDNLPIDKMCIRDRSAHKPFEKCCTHLARLYAIRPP